MDVAALFMRGFGKNLYPKLAFFDYGVGLSDEEKQELTSIIHDQEGNGLVDAMYNQWQAGRYYQDGPIILRRMTWQYPISGSMQEIRDKMDSYYQK